MRLLVLIGQMTEMSEEKSGETLFSPGGMDTKCIYFVDGMCGMRKGTYRMIPKCSEDISFSGGQKYQEHVIGPEKCSGAMMESRMGRCGGKMEGEKVADTREEGSERRRRRKSARKDQERRSRGE